MAKTIKIADDVMEVLQRSTITESSLVLPDQLDRRLYEAVNKVIVAAGGKWSRGKRAHVFTGDPREALGMAMETGEIVNQKQLFQEFFTPMEIVERMCDGVTEGETVLEPSAGNGRIAKHAADMGAKVFCCELQTQHCDTLRQDDRLIVHEGDFLQLAVDAIRPVDFVLMNPPFTAGQCQRHVRHAFDFLRPGGRLIAVMPLNLGERNSKESKQFMKWMDEQGYEISEIPEQAFREEGTRISTCLLTIDKRSSQQ